MKILALDTATEACSTALWIDGACTTREVEFERGHAEHILSMVNELLAGAGVVLGGLDAIAFGRGPGSFTGVRLAASVTQGLAFGADLPVVPISDLRAVAQRVLKPSEISTRSSVSEAAEDLEAVRVLVCNDARMQEVYWACFERAADGLAALVGEEQVGKPETVVLPGVWKSGVRGAGRGFAAYPALQARLAGFLASVDDRVLPHSAEIATLAVPEVLAGRVLRPEEATPVYVRDDVAWPRV